MNHHLSLEGQDPKNNTRLLEKQERDGKKREIHGVPLMTLDEFYRKYFFRELPTPRVSKCTRRTHPVFTKILGKLNHELEIWIEEKSMKEHEFMIHNAACMRKALKREFSIKYIFVSAFSRIKEQELIRSIQAQVSNNNIATRNWSFLSELVHVEFFKYLTDFDFHRVRIRKGLGIYSQLQQTDHPISYWKFILNMKDTNKSNMISLQRMVFDWTIFREHHNQHWVILDFLRATSDVFASMLENEEAETLSQHVSLDSIFDGITHYLQCKFSSKERTKFMKTLLLRFLRDTFSHTNRYMAIFIFEKFKQHFRKTYNVLFERPLHKYVKLRSRYGYRAPSSKNSLFSLYIDSEYQLFLLEYYLNTLYFETEFLVKFITQSSDEYRTKIGLIYYSSSNATPTCEFLDFKPTDVNEGLKTVFQCRKVYEKFGKEARFEKDLEKELIRTVLGVSGHEFLLNLSQNGLISKSFTERCTKNILFSIWDRHIFRDFDDKLVTMLEDTQTILSKFDTDGRLSLEKIHLPHKNLDHFDSFDLQEASQKFPKCIRKQKSHKEFKRVYFDVLYEANPLCLFLLEVGRDTNALEKVLNHSFFSQYWNTTVTVPYLYDMMYPQPVALGHEILYCYDDSYSLGDVYFRVYLKKMTLKQLLYELIEKNKEKKEQSRSV
ncbi:hypothetical protein C9374_006093 [Naegleria lovaniensis]|uniref:Uncharacterized protein n=1 Tax=Naegleria lovaniensis TaxID=51637 RepID=A0AA88KHE9_NAELO|nr:uncharacterized protein C9374_006093 [Naegleria lovaniensis]KAG2381709.1 hypothetical protein C9374_006093 [Naegleria lovaniensis]